MTANNYLKSPGYVKVIQWLSIASSEFEEITIILSDIKLFPKLNCIQH